MTQFLSKPVFAAVLALVVAGWVSGLFFPELGRIESETARSIELALEGGGWLIPRQDDGPDLRKPPLLFWLSGAVAAVGGGAWTLPVRLPAMLASLCTLGVMFWYARRRFGPEPAALAVAILALTADFSFYSRTGARGHDNLLCLATTVLVASTDAYWRSRRTIHLVPVVLALAAGVLAKGFPILLIAGLFFVGVLVCSLFLKPRFDASPLIGLGVAVLAATVVSGAWFVFAMARIPGYADFLRSASVMVLSRENDVTLAFYALYGLPWSILVPWVASGFLRRRPSARDDVSILLLGGWASAAGVVLGLILRGGEHYLLSFYPLASVLMAVELDFRIRSGEPLPGVMRVCIAGAAALALFAFIPLLNPRVHEEVAREFLERRSPVPAVFGAATGAAFLAWAFRWRRIGEPRKVFVYLCAAGLAMIAGQLFLDARRAQAPGFGDFAAKANAAMRGHGNPRCIAVTGHLPAPVRWLPACVKHTDVRNIRLLPSTEGGLFVVAYHPFRSDVPKEGCRLLLVSEQAKEYDDTLYLHFCPQLRLDDAGGR